MAFKIVTQFHGGAKSFLDVVGTHQKHLLLQKSVETGNWLIYIFAETKEVFKTMHNSYVL